MEPTPKLRVPGQTDPHEDRERILERVVLVCPRNDAESQTIAHLAEKLGMTVITSDQKHGATLDREPDLANRLSATQKQEVWIVEIPSAAAEEALRAQGLTVEVIDHHRYGNLDRTQGADGRALPSSLEQFMAKTHITDAELTAWGYDPKTIRGVGIMDHGFVQGLRNHQYDPADIARVVEFRQRLAAELDPHYSERVQAAALDWARRREQEGFIVVESTLPYDVTTFVSDAAIIDDVDTRPKIISVLSGTKIYVQNISPAGVRPLIDHFKSLVAEPRLAFGFGSNCMGVDNTGNRQPVLLSEVIEQAKSFIDPQETTPNTAREGTPSPVQVAEDRFKSLIMDDAEQQRTFRDLRCDIIALQAPGGSVVYTRDNVEQRKNTDHFGGETWETRGTTDVRVTSYYLAVGVRPNEDRRYDWRGLNPLAVKSFRINQPSDGEDPEDIRKNLLAENNQALQLEFTTARELNPPPQAEEYRQAWMSLQHNVEARWLVEDTEILNRMRVEYDTYQAAADELIRMRAVVNNFDRRMRRLGVHVSAGSAPEQGTIGHDSLEILRGCVQTLRKYADEMNALIAEELRQRGEVEMTSEVLQTALEAPAAPAPWYLSGVEPAQLEAFDRKPGEGFGLKVAGTNQSLPGSKAVVGIGIDGGGSRYHKDLVVRGLTSLQQGSFPQRVTKRAETLLGVVEDPNWAVLWTESKDDVPFHYSLANARGIAHLYHESGRSDGHESKDWNGADGAGPTADEVRAAHHLAIERGVPVQSKGVVTPASAPSGFGSLGDALRGNPKTVATAEPAAKVPAPPRETQPAEPEAMTPELLDSFTDQVEVLQSLIGQLRILGNRPKLKTGDRPTDSDKALQALYDNAIPGCREAVVTVQTELTATNPRPERIRGLVADLRRRVDSAWDKTGVRTIPGYRKDWMGTYLTDFEAIPAAVQANATVAEYIREGEVTAEAITTETRRLLNEQIPQRVTGQPVSTMNESVEQALGNVVG